MTTKTTRIIVGTLGGIALLALVLYMGGFLTVGQIGPADTVEAAVGTREPTRTTEVAVRSVPQWYEAVGTLEAAVRTRVESRIIARVDRVEVTPGDRVSQGDLLVKLDARQGAAKVAQAEKAVAAAEAALSQARSGLDAAEAALEKAESQYQRIQVFVQEQAATERDLEKTKATYLQAKAARQQAESGVHAAQSEKLRAADALTEARIALGYADIRAPSPGRVAETPVDTGDLARPGKPLVYIESEGAPRLRALVPERLLEHVTVGGTIPVRLDALSRRLQAELIEIVPSADPRSHTFVVRAELPRLDGIYPGMFGRLLIPIGTRQAVVVSADAIRQVGQLDLIRIRQEDRWVTVPVVVGPITADGVEILSGLTGKETAALTGETDG